MRTTSLYVAPISCGVDSPIIPLDDPGLMGARSESYCTFDYAVARICCLDLDTFFVSVERLLDPTLVGKPVVVGGVRGGRGVVTSASYEVRRFGVRSGQPIVDASRIAPRDAVFLPTRHGTYSPYAKKVRAVLERYSPIIRTASIDEFFVDFRGCESLYRKADDRDDDQTIHRVVSEMRQAIQRDIGLPASAGIGVNRTISKIASGQAKPAGVCMVPPGHELAFLAPLAVRRYPGVGPVAEQRLRDAGIETLGQLIQCRDTQGWLGTRARAICKNITDPQAAELGDERPLFLEYDRCDDDHGSISNERTFAAQFPNSGVVQNHLQSLTERVCWRARQRALLARTISIKVRTETFETCTRSHTGPATADEFTVLRIVRELFERAKPEPGVRIRLLGVAMTNFETAAPQLDLNFDIGRRPTISAALDPVRQRFGYDVVRVGITDAKSTWIRDDSD